ncbi:MAG: dCMP deaminase, partial [Dehalococcoidia bacterium]
GSNIKDSSIYVTHTPCIHCIKVLVNTGINTVYYESPYKLDTLEEILRNTRVHMEKVQLPGK